MILNVIELNDLDAVRETLSFESCYLSSINATQKRGDSSQIEIRKNPINKSHIVHAYIHTYVSVCSSCYESTYLNFVLYGL